MKSAPLLRPEVLTLAFTAAAALPSLLETWRHAPLERWSVVAFLIWIVPVFNALRKRNTATGSPLVWLSLLLLATGAAMDLHVLRHAALACSLGALVPWSGRSCVWLVLALPWMPAAGWLAAHLLPGPAQALRIVLCGAGAAVALLPLKIPAPRSS